MKEIRIFIVFAVVSLLFIASEHYLQRKPVISVDRTSLYQFFHDNYDVLSVEAFDELLADFDQADVEVFVERLLTEELLYRQGLQAGLDQEDSDIRQIVVEKAKNQLEMQLLSQIDLSEQQLRRYYSENLEQYRSDALISVELVSLRSAARAAEVLVELQQNSAIEPADYRELTTMPGRIREASEQRLTLIFGEGIATLFSQIARQSELHNQWQPAFENGGGHHLFRITAYHPSRAQSYSEVSDQLSNDVLINELGRKYRQQLEQIRQQYKIEVQPVLSEEKSADA
ncbi:peptidyl-prolyl cis-trans isomerase [Aliagarivorans marinus]|uniref:peptidylprolyl isomerase n=1 Tax=Aliagarivorans marinus TaxID=561965 RepID=UPI000415086C|nr:peptidylprolyl isomerase [Aliagarivorans marinus]